MPPTLKFYTETYGCQMNAADSEEMNAHLLRGGLATTLKKEEADVLLLNTCTVRQHAEQRALSYIGRLKDWKRKNPERILIVAGCAAERLEKNLKRRFPHVDLVVGAKKIDEFPEIVKKVLKERYDWFGESEGSFDAHSSRPEGAPMVLADSQCAYVTVMRGCNYSCSYCIVPYVRGREIYRPVSVILQEIESKAGQGATEVMLLGQTVNSYWFQENNDSGGKKITDFADLIQKVQEIPGVQKIRFMSPHPHYLSDKLIRTLGECSKVSPEIHLPVQSGSDRILAAMKRNYTREEYIGRIYKLKKSLPALSLTTDFIVGFPTESEDDFLLTLSLAHELGLYSAYCFKYSPRDGTESAKMPDDVPQAVKESRLARLLQEITPIKKLRFD